MPKSRIYIISVLVLMFFAGWLYISNNAREDWSATFYNFEKKPFDTYILYKLLPTIFPESKIIETSSNLASFCIENNTEQNVNVIHIEGYQYLKDEQVNDILQFVGRGNNLFLSSLNFSNSLLDSLQMYQQKDYIYFDYAADDSIYLQKEKFSFVHLSKQFEIQKNFKIENKKIFYYGDSVDHFNVLGFKENIISNQNEDNFVVLEINKGKIFLHSSPIYFTNYAILKENVSDYVAAVFSHLPDQKTYWIQDQSISKEVGESPLRYILNDPYLKWAWYTLLLSFFILGIFAIKRKQNYIPIISPLKNNSLDFVKTVAQLYYGKNDNTDLAHKKGIYFAEKFKSQYGIVLSINDKDVANLIMAKTGAELNKTLKLIAFLKQASNFIYFNDKELFEFHETITYFYQKMKE